MTARRQIVLVTDPMCSWCWGMADEFELARERLGEVVDFELMLGGINTHGTQPIGDYGRRFLMRLWREVQATTGQTFGFKLPEQYIHNSARTCLALQAARELVATVPFEFLHALQRAFFVDGLDITNETVIMACAEQVNIDPQDLIGEMDEPKHLESIRFQFEAASGFGTQALPSLAELKSGELKLVAGGYVDADMLASLLVDAG
ncbi:MAG: hypothetical protein GKR90_04310 [Pseudomonadales bacterium]|nr:hypothetical protein [Pseudomonadales bacterium]